MELLPHRPGTAMTAAGAAISVLLIYGRLVRTVESVDRVDPSWLIQCAPSNPLTGSGGLLKVAGPGKPGLLADAEPEGSDAFRLRAADRFQVYPGEAWGGEADAVAEQDRQDLYHDLVDEPPSQALAGDVGAEDLEVLAARGIQRGGDRFPDVTGEVGDIRVRRVRRLVGEDEHGSVEGVAFASGFCPPVVVGFHPVADLNGSPADEHGAGGRCGLLLPGRVIRHEVEDPVHRVTGTGDEAVQRHRPGHDHLAGSGAGIAHAVPPKSLGGSPDPFRRVSGRRCRHQTRDHTTRKGSLALKVCCPSDARRGAC